MKQEDKELLIKDLCARLPYGIKGIEANSICLLNTSTHFKSLIKNIEYKIEHLGFKPYLFPLSSMTPEQRTSYNFLSNSGHRSFTGLIDFYHKNHLDWRGLIPKGLAIDCTNLNIY